jgi:hypothetical protein
MTYTYTFYDGNPDASGTALDDHADVEVEGDSIEEIVADVKAQLEIVCAGLAQFDGYAVGDRIFVTVWADDGSVAARLSHELTAEDLGLEDSDEYGDDDGGHDDGREDFHSDG